MSAPPTRPVPRGRTSCPRYHPAWHEDRQREKLERILRFADGLPSLRTTVAGHLRKRRLSREKALAAATRLLDRTHIRVGTEQYAAENETSTSTA